MQGARGNLEERLRSSRTALEIMALLQQLNRDTQKFALKCSAARVNGKWIDVYKEPVTDKGKMSRELVLGTD